MCINRFGQAGTILSVGVHGVRNRSGTSERSPGKRTILVQRLWNQGVSAGSRATVLIQETFSEPRMDGQGLMGGQAQMLDGSWDWWCCFLTRRQSASCQFLLGLLGPVWCHVSK